MFLKKLFFTPLLAFVLISSSELTVKDTFFKTLGTYQGDDKFGSYYQKIYYYPRYIQTTWMVAKMICKTYNLELASIKTQMEAYAVMDLINKNPELALRNDLWAFIDGIALVPRTTTEWYNTDSGDKIDFAMTWYAAQPDNYGNIENFLSIGKPFNDQTVGFNDVPASRGLMSKVCLTLKHF